MHAFACLAFRTLCQNLRHVPKSDPSHLFRSFRKQRARLEKVNPPSAHKPTRAIAGTRHKTYPQQLD